MTVTPLVARPLAASTPPAAPPAPATPPPQDPPREKISISSNVLQAAALVGIPSAVGALEHAALGAGKAAALTVVASPAAGALIGAGVLGVGAYRMSRGNPIFTALGGLLGAGVGTVAWPLLKLPGALGGWTGAAVATGIAGVAAGVWVLSQAGRMDIRP